MEGYIKRRSDFKTLAMVQIAAYSLTKQSIYDTNSSVTIVGIPVGTQCFKMAGLAFFPFGKEVEYGGGAGSAILNVLWFVFGGVFLALEALLNGVLLCITVIGIPFGLQCFKQAKLALLPFGAVVRGN